MTRFDSAALAAAVTFCVSAGAAQAAAVCSSPVNLVVPATGEGLYVNFVTGGSGEAESQVPGFDLDIYAQQLSNPAGQLRFYWGASTTGGAGGATAGDTYVVLAPGDVVGTNRLFSRAGANGNTTAWQAGVTGFLGVRFKNEGTGVINYGWVKLATTAPLGFPATIVEWCYDDTGGPIATDLSGDIFTDGFEAAE